MKCRISDTPLGTEILLARATQYCLLAKRCHIIHTANMDTKQMQHSKKQDATKIPLAQMWSTEAPPSPLSPQNEPVLLTVPDEKVTAYCIFWCGLRG
jgi:hypothetical protein